MALVIAALASYALLTLLSQVWSDAPGRALVEFDRTLLYLLVMVIFSSLAHSSNRLVWLLRALTLAIVVICACGLITRLLPHLWPITPELANNRLSFPLTYWNALGLFAAFGVVLCLHFSSDTREAAVTRVLAAAAIPILSATIYFTFSRGGIAAALLGVILYALIARPRALVGAVAAAAPTTAVAVKFAYGANLLATATPTTAGAVAQGRHVALALLACVLVAAIGRWLLVLSLDKWLDRLHLREHRLLQLKRLGWGTLATAVVIAAVTLNGAIARDYHRFVSPALPGNAADLRARLTDPGNDGRLDMWRVAWQQFQREPMLGRGAGTFGNTWAQYRPNNAFVVDAHSLYMETLDELGIVGFVLLVAVIAMFLIRAAMMARGPTRSLYTVVFTMIVIWALHAGIDWDWEMPVVTLPVFALGGLMLARPISGYGQPPSALSELRLYRRTVVGVAFLLLAIAPAYLWLSQRRLDQATSAFAQRDCAAATRSALSSISILGDRPEPYELVSYCDIRRDMPGLAIATIEKAISLDPNNWDLRYDLAVMRASAGLDPMPALRTAVMLDPREALIHEALATFKGAGPGDWEREGKAIADQFTTL
jgi:O-antigen ligase